jgi:predicted nucleotidyltransferase
MDLGLPLADLMGAAPARIVARLALLGDGASGRQVAELAGVTKDTAARVLERLVGVGLVSRRSVGRAAIFSLNREHVLWPQIERILDTPQEIERALAAVAREVVADRGTVAVYGSLARGRAGSQSDVDVAIVWDDDTDAEHRDEAVDAIRSRMSALTGNRVEIVDVTQDELTGMAGDALIDSWREEARTVTGLDLTTRIARLPR